MHLISFLHNNCTHSIYSNRAYFSIIFTYGYKRLRRNWWSFSFQIGCNKSLLHNWIRWKLVTMSTRFYHLVTLYVNWLKHEFSIIQYANVKIKEYACTLKMMFPQCTCIVYCYVWWCFPGILKYRFFVHIQIASFKESSTERKFLLTSIDNVIEIATKTDLRKLFKWHGYFRQCTIIYYM